MRPLQAGVPTASSFAVSGNRLALGRRIPARQFCQRASTAHLVVSLPTLIPPRQADRCRRLPGGLAVVGITPRRRPIGKVEPAGTAGDCGRLARSVGSRESELAFPIAVCRGRDADDGKSPGTAGQRSAAEGGMEALQRNNKMGVDARCRTACWYSTAREPVARNGELGCSGTPACSGRISLPSARTWDKNVWLIDGPQARDLQVHARRQTKLLTIGTYGDLAATTALQPADVHGLAARRHRSRFGWLQRNRASRSSTRTAKF